MSKCLLCQKETSDEELNEHKGLCVFCTLRKNPFFQIITSLIISSIITYLLVNYDSQNNRNNDSLEAFQCFLVWFDIALGWCFISGLGFQITRLFTETNSTSGFSIFLFILIMPLKVFAGAFVGPVALIANIIKIFGLFTDTK